MEVNHGNAPGRVLLNGHWLEVSPVRRPWRIDQHWWRAEPVSRLYYEVALQDGTTFTIFHNLVRDTWSRQAYT